MMSTTEEKSTRNDATTSPPFKQAYDDWQRKSRWYRNFEIEQNRKFRASAPPFRTKHRTLQPLFHTNFAPRVPSIKAPSLNPYTKFSSSESATLTPRSPCSDVYSPEFDTTGDADTHHVSCDSTFFDEEATSEDIGSLRRGDVKLIMDAGSVRQDVTHEEESLSRIIAKRRKKSLEAHFKILPQGMVGRGADSSNSDPSSTEKRQGTVKCDVLKQKDNFKVVSEKNNASLEAPLTEPKEFFLKMIIHKVLTKKRKRTSLVRRISLLDKHITVPKEAFLKLKVNAVIKQIGYIKERQRLRNCRRLINLEITTSRRKSAVIDEIKRKSVAIQKHVGLIFDFDDSQVRVVQEVNLERLMEEYYSQRERKSLVCKEIRTRSHQIKLKTKVTQIIKAQGLKVKLMSEVREWWAKRPRHQLNEEKSNIVINAHRKTWGNACSETVRSTSRMLIEQKGHAVPSKKWRVHGNEQVNLGSRFANNPLVRSMYLKMLCNKEIRQRGFKKKMHRELLERVRTVELKTKLCLEVVEHDRTRKGRLNVGSAARRNNLCSEADRQTSKAQSCTEEMEPEKVLSTTFHLKDSYNLKKTNHLKNAIHHKLENIGGQCRIKKLKRRKGSVLKELVQVDNKLILQKKRLIQEIKNKRFVKSQKPKQRKRQLDLMIRQHLLKNRVNREICQRQKQRVLKKRLLQELRMVKLKMLVCFEIKRVSQKKHADSLNKQRSRRVRSHQAYLKSMVVNQIAVMGRKMRVMKEIKERKSKGTLIPKVRRTETLVSEYGQSTRFVNLDDVPSGSPETPIKTHYTSYTKFKEMLEDLKVRDKLNSAVREYTILRLRTEVDERKALMNSEFRMRVIKKKCMIEIMQKVKAKRDYKAVCQEIKQRTCLGRCVQDIKLGCYYLRHVKLPVENSSMVICKQQILKQNLNTIIKQARRKGEVNLEIIQRHTQRMNKALVIEEIKRRAMTMQICKEIRVMAEARQRAAAIKLYNATIDELKQRFRKRELTKEIKTRQKQIFWKKSTCTIIKQGGYKILVNKDIRVIGKQKYLKKQINTLIRQGGLKSQVQKEIRKLRKIAELRKQKSLKAKVNLSILQIAKAHKNKREVCMVIKQSGLKARCNKEIRSQKVHLLPLHSQQQARPSKHYESLQQKQMESEGEHPDAFDDMDIVYGNKVSRKGLEVMKLVERLHEGSRVKEQRDKEIRDLTAFLTQQRADFEALTKRVVDDKDRLYQQIDNLKRENTMLREMMVKQRRQVQGTDNKRQKKDIKRQQISQIYQEMQEFVRGKTHRGGKIQQGQIEHHGRMRLRIF